MSLVTGRIIEITVAQAEDSFAKIVVVDDDTGSPEHFLVFSSDNTLPPFANWIAHSFTMSLARDALINKLKVSVLTADSSSVILQLSLLSP
jgi:hypothetical protein